MERGQSSKGFVKRWLFGEDAEGKTEDGEGSDGRDDREEEEDEGGK